MNTSSQTDKPIERHDVGPIEDWRLSLRNAVDRRSVILNRVPLPSDGTDLLECDCDIAALASLFTEESNRIAEAVALGAGAAAAAVLCHSESDGNVLLVEPQRPAREIPAGDARLNPATWRDGFVLACAARDRDALEVLCTPARIEACQLPADRADAFWPSYCRALACIVSTPQDFETHARTAFELMDKAGIAPPDVLNQIDRPLLELARALLAKDESAWNNEVARALEKHHAYYGSEGHRFDRRGFLSFGIIGLCALAHDRGLETRVESPYLPLNLVRGSDRASLSVVTYVYPPRTIVRAEEAIWFLDLEGFSRATRSHHLIEDGQYLQARYEAHGAAGLPHARIDFVLADDETQVRRDAGVLPPRALDAGELLLLAEVFATEAGNKSLPIEERRALLSEAVDCVEIALEGIPPGENSVSPGAIESERGRKLYDAEPGRFRRERMAAYRDELVRYLQTLDGQNAHAGESAPASMSPTEESARTSAYASIEIIKAQVTPILEAIARDRTGEVARMLRPRDDDYAKVFVGDAIRVAREAYERMWEAGLDIEYPSAQQTDLLVYVAPAGMLSEENELSWQFPSGYRAIARLLNPHRVWVRWKYVRPGETSGLAYDGLVWCDDHWAWFPKPFRAIATGGLAGSGENEPAN